MSLPDASVGVMFAFVGPQGVIVGVHVCNCKLVFGMCIDVCQVVFEIYFVASIFVS